MRYPPSLLDEIRARLPVSDVVGRKVRLKRAGREWKGLSPFNAEKSPSFFVNDQKGFYHCFSSGKHGDVFAFLMETEGLSFTEAVERLAGEAGVELPKVSAESRAEESKRSNLYEVMELAAAFFESTLRERAGAKARDYLDRRGLHGDIRARFRLGYAPSHRFALRDHLAGKGVAKEAMIEAGLLVSAEDVAVPYDRFRDRVIFPITDPRGRVVAFGGRALSADVPAKYLNSPDTPLFQKGRLLYNLHQARGPAHDRGTVVVVEGYVDAIALSVVGFPNTVAPLGTALTEEQLALLWRVADEPVLCFDGDKAGRRAAYRAVDLALPVLAPGKSLRFALLPEGQDPDDLARTGGAAAVERVLTGARPLEQVLWSREWEAKDIRTNDDLAAFERRLMLAVATIKEPDLRKFYVEEFRLRIRNMLRGETSGRKPVRGGAYPRDKRAAPTGVLNETKTASPVLARSAVFLRGSESPREAVIVSTLLGHPELLQAHAEALADLELGGHAAGLVRGVLLDSAADFGALHPASVEARLERAGLRGEAERLAAQVRPGDRWMLDPHADRQRLEDALRQAVTLHRKALTLHRELRAAERALAEDEIEANLTWLRDIQAQISSLDGAEADLEGDLSASG